MSEWCVVLIRHGNNFIVTGFDTVDKAEDYKRKKERDGFLAFVKQVNELPKGKLKQIV